MSKKQKTSYDSNIESALKVWCDNNLTNSRSYRGNIGAGSPIAGIDNWYLIKDRPGILTYQDGTACSASHAFADIYKVVEGDVVYFDVYMDCGAASYQGEGSSLGYAQKHSFPSLVDVLDFLSSYCGHDPNSTGELLIYIKGWLKSNEITSFDDGFSFSKLSTCTFPALAENISKHVAYRAT